MPEATLAKPVARTHAPVADKRPSPKTHAHAPSESGGVPLFLQSSPVQEQVQLWDCTDITEPTCTEESGVQQKAAAGAEPVQMCECEEAGDPEEEEPVQQCECGGQEEDAVQMCECGGQEEETTQMCECGGQEEEATQMCECSEEEPVQQQCSACKRPRRTPGLIHREARRGVAAATEPLPHSDRIQKAFGHHDVSDVRTTVGGPAQDASTQMGAEAFTVGNRIGFRQSPSVHLAAHEAAHTVQQRAGLSLPGGVSRVGDPWERHADSVADAVAEGRSAEPLLDEVAKPTGTATDAEPAVQQQITSYASRLFEMPPLPPFVPSSAEISEEEASDSEGGEGEEPEAEAADEGDVMDAAEGGDAEPPPEGAAEGGGGGGASADGAAAASAEPPAPTEAAGLGDCYNEDIPPEPEEEEEPESDNPPNEAQAEESVTFPEWEDAADVCPPPAAQAAMEQAGEATTSALAEGGGGGGEAGGAGAAPPAGGGAPAEGASAATDAAAPAAEAAPGGGGAAPTAGAGGGAGGGGGGEAAPDGAAAESGIEDAIVTAAGERDAAVTDYYDALGNLAQAETRSQHLDRFALSVGDGQKEAVLQVQAFMATASMQMAGAIAFARDQVPGRLGGLAEAMKGSLQGAMEIEKAAISARIEQARQQAYQGAASARAHVISEYTTSIATVESETASAIATLDAEHDTSVSLVDEKETTALDDVNARFATGRTTHEEKGPEFSQRAVARGQEHASNYEHCKGDYDDDGLFTGCLTVRRAKAQQDAACKTAAGYKKAFLRMANKKAYDLLEVRKQYRCAVISGAAQVNQTLDQTHGQLVAGLESGRRQARSGLGLARTQNLRAIDSALRATLQALSAQEFAQRQTVNDTGYLKQVAIEQLAHGAAANLARGVTGAMDKLEQTLGALSEQLAAGGRLDPVALGRMLGTTEGAMGGAMAMLLGKMEEGAASAEGRIIEAAVAGLEALTAITTSNSEQTAQAESGYASQMSGLRRGASRAFSQLTNNHVQQCQTSSTEGVTSMQDAVAGFDEALATIGGKVDEAIAKSLGELEKQLQDKLNGLDAQIIREANKAASKEQPAWVKVLAVVLIILVIIAATIISIVTLGAGAGFFAIILVGALVGAVSAGLIQILSNWMNGETWHEGLVQAMVMGAIGGALGGALGFAGGALASGAAAVGARVVTQFAIQAGADLIAEGLTQTFGYVVFGQEFNWQGFVMAGAMSGVSFRAHPGAGVPRVAAPRPRAGTGVATAAAGAGVGLVVEGGIALATGQELDAARLASAASSGAAGAHASRRGGGGGAEAPTGRPRADTPDAPDAPRPRATAPDEPSITSALDARLKRAGARLVGGDPDLAAPAPRRTGETPESTTPRRTEEAEGGTPRRTTEEAEGATPPPRTTEDAEGATPRRTTDEAEGATTPRPIDEELQGPANRMSEEDLIEATNTRQRVGGEDHDFRITRDGPEVCTGCAPTRSKVEAALEALSPEAPAATRRRLQELHDLVVDVEGRLARGESGRDMMDASGRIAREFRALAADHPILGKSLVEPHLTRTGEGPTAETSAHLRALGVDAQHVETVAATDFRRIPMEDGDTAIYLLRDPVSGAVLKVGIAENHLGRATQYANAARKLGRPLQMEVAIVRPIAGSPEASMQPAQFIRDVESRLRGRLEREGNVLPWDNWPTGRLGRSDRGTPFVHPVSKDLMWDANGNLVNKNSGAPPPPTRRGMATPEELAGLIHQGMSTRDIATLKGVSERTVQRWRLDSRAEIDQALAAMRATDEG
jgi:hypothetical protein